MTEKPSQAQRLALILQAVEDLKFERSEYLAEVKQRLERLLKEQFRLRQEILSGQLVLIPEGETPKEVA